ncbi:hypothetical protein LAZ67_18001615 [Cordylochernes scorpioides]|uniref:Uncharacterized protein n=1 Tax=Cordylochernes scorpioides TaxID=51811 RepID=A0ABY6LGT7_9ARAC|nr:hypothetical protein LAZ67_18001615 [Cordylochernes scorpioides]
MLQRYNVKNVLIIRIPALNLFVICDVIQAFKEDVLSQSRIFELLAQFKAGRTSVKDDLHTGRPFSNDLYLKRSPAKFVPHLLTNEQKEHRKETCKNMVEMFNYDPLWLKNVIMGDETWVYGYDP